MPQKTVGLYYVQGNPVTVTFGAIGGYIRSVVCPISASAGFYCGPLKLPSDVDLSRPMIVTLLVATVLASIDDGEDVRFFLAAQAARDGVLSSAATLFQSWPVPDGWSAGDPRSFSFDNGNGVTFDGGTFAPTDVVGMTVQRLGGATEDTYQRSIYLAMGVALTYYQRCQKICC